MIRIPLDRLIISLSVLISVHCCNQCFGSHHPAHILETEGSITSILNNSDCFLTATIISDMEICEQQTIDLDADITGDYQSFEWTSTEGYSNTTDLNPSVSVSTTTTFTFTATGLSGVNAVVNGDFSSGFIGFTSEYTFNPGTNLNGLGQGSFNIDVQTPNLWENCPPMDGEMMVVNGATVTNEEVYCTTIAVCPNTDYQLSADVMNINDPAPILQFSANGVLLGSPITGGAECNVEQFFDVWNSGSDTSIEMCIVNQSTVASGNDFALDNISIEEICTVNEQFEVIVHTLDIGTQDSPHLDCNDPTATIAPNYSGGQVTSYDWSTSDGNILFGTVGPSIEVDQAGEYFVDISYGHNCIKTTSIIVTDDFVTPDVFISDPIAIDCNFSSSAITVIGQPDYTYFWVLPNGMTSFQEDLNTITLLGDYALTVTDQSNGCTESWLVEIEEDLDTIPLNIAVSNDLDCVHEVATLTVQPSVTPSSILWSDGQGGMSIDVDTAGSYSVMVTGVNGCTSTDVVEVDDTSIEIEYFISQIDTLTCIQEALELYTTLITDNVSAQWTQGGVIVDSDTITATQSDVYYLTLSTDDGCEEFDSVFVEIDTLIPTYTLHADTLKCLVPSVSLSVDSDSIHFVTWITPTNEIVTQPTFDTSQPGEYQVYLSGSNGCVDTTTVMVQQEANFPEIMISGVDTINCTIDQIDLSAIVSLPTVLAEWTLPNNSNTDQADISITEPGTYLYSVETVDGCKKSQEVTIEIDTVLPLIDFTPDTLLTCDLVEVSQTFTSSEDVVANWYQESQLIITNDTIVNTEAGLYTLEVIADNGCKQQYPYEVTQDTLSPTLDVEYNSIDCTHTTSEIIVSTDGDSYSIEQSITGVNVSNQSYTTTEAGLISVIAENANGCTTAIDLMVDIDTLSPSITAHAALPITCVNESVTPTIEGSNPSMTYEWTGPNSFVSDLADPSLTEAGNYFLTVTSPNGCTDNVALSIEIDTLSPTVEMSVDLPITCVNEEVTPDVTTTGINLVYDWDGPSNFDSDQAEPTLTDPGNYSLRVTDSENGCTDTATIQVAIDTLTPSIAVDIGQPFNCVNMVIFPDVTYVGDDLIYEWTGPDNFQSDLPIPMLTLDGTYTIGVTASNGCSYESTFAIAIDTVTLSPIVISDNLTCDNQSVTLNLDNASDYFAVQWINLQTGDTQLASSIQVSEQGNYQVVGTHDNGCQVTELVEVLDTQDQLTVEIYSSITELTCAINEITLNTSVSPDYIDYEWSSDVIGFNESTPEITVTEPGSYTVLVTDVNGCTGQQAVTITQDVSEPSPVITSSPYDCITESNQLSVEADIGEIISFNSMISADGLLQLLDNETNEISVSVQGLNGCRFDTLVTFQAFENLSISTIDTLQINSTEDTQLIVTHNRDDAEILSIEWSPSDGLSCNDCLDPIYTIMESQEITITITDVYGCVETATIILLYEESIDVFVGNIYLPSDDPSGDRFKALANIDKVKNVDLVSVYDRWGNLIFTQSDLEYTSSDYGWDGTYNGDIVEQGVYVYLFQLTLVNDEKINLVGDVTIIH